MFFKSMQICPSNTRHVWSLKKHAFWLSLTLFLIVSLALALARSLALSFALSLSHTLSLSLSRTLALSLSLSFSLPVFLSHTHTHKHTHIKTHTLTDLQEQPAGPNVAQNPHPPAQATFFGLFLVFFVVVCWWTFFWVPQSTTWRALKTLILKLQVSFRKKAANHRALLRRMINWNKASSASSWPCRRCAVFSNKCSGKIVNVQEMHSNIHTSASSPHTGKTVFPNIQRSWSFSAKETHN